MTDDELLAKAIEKLRALEARCADAPETLGTVTVDQLPKRCIRDAVVIDFERDEKSGRIRTFMDRESGKMISAEYFPPKDANTDKTI